MLATQLQLKWPNHSTHLLTGLKSLFKNEQLVDCTLKCNKHILKVHRSVLAACSPYFERELQNNPSIVIQDMQFNVLQALIEFMYYGETRISEENLTSVIEAAKLFEVKGLSEMDLFTSNERSIISSIVSVNNNGVLQNGTDKLENVVFGNASQSLINTSCKMDIEPSIVANNISSDDSNDSHCNLIDSQDPSQPHANRNFVITPPQTESAQILLSLAHSYNEKRHIPLTTNNHLSDDILPVAKTVDNNVFLNENNFVLNNIITNSSNNTSVTSINTALDEQLPCSQSLPVTSVDNSLLFVKYHTPEEKYNSNLTTSSSSLAASNKSLLAKLLTRNVHDQPKSSLYYENFKTLYDHETASTAADPVKTLEEVVDTSQANFKLQPDAILDCPFLIETNDGYVDVPVESMFNVFDNCEIFDPNAKSATKILPRENIAPCIQFSAKNRMKDIDEMELQRVKQDTEDELKDDPEAVVLCKVDENGQVKKYVLSSADIEALKLMNEQMKPRRNVRSCSDIESPHIEVELPTSTGNTSLITFIFNEGDQVENAISKLPFKKTGRIGNSNEVNAANRILEDASLAVDSHQHENMFEELDNQFNLDCSIENMQCDYVAYEEASKNETQLEHNYYANALKDEDEECVVINDNYDLRSMMLIEEPAEGNLNIVALSNNNIKRKDDANATAISSFELSAAQDVYLNGCSNSSREPRRNGIIEKPVYNKCDLITNNDALMSSVFNTVMTSATSVTSKSKARTAKSSSLENFRSLKNSTAEMKRRAVQYNDNVVALPFKKVKSTGRNNNSPLEKKPKRTYRRRSTSSNDEKKLNENNSVNGSSFHEESSLVEEIIVDEIV